MIPRLLAVAAAASAVGCSADPFPNAQVSGRVTLDGKPLADARVGFEPVRKEGAVNAGLGSYAETDADGRFTLTRLDKKPGAVVGGHKVWFRTFRMSADGPDGKLLRAEILPKKYHEQTTLTFTVPEGGTVEANFDLTLK